MGALMMMSKKGQNIELTLLFSVTSVSLGPTRPGILFKKEQKSPAKNSLK